MFQFRRGPIRALVAFSIIAAALTGGVASAQATAEAPSAISAVTLRYNIPAQDLTAALTAFAHQSRAELIYAPDAAEGRQSATLNGAFSAVEAVEQILQGTGLDFVVTDGGGIMIGEPDVVAEYRRRLQNSSTGNLAVAQAKALADDASPADAPLPDIESARRAGIEEIIVTGQKREERLQDVPITMSAFSMDELDARKVEGGFDLLKAIPNVTFSKTNFSGYNFQIRGIGTQAVSATTDPGVAVSMNNTTLIVNRLFEQEYLDMERVEVLRGPQGTLYGRNATAGVINVITHKPVMGVFEGEVKYEIGNYGAQRFRGHYNIPLNDSDTLAARIAYASTMRDGYGTNLAAGEFNVSPDLDNRDLWTGRVSIAWQPTDRFRADFIFERFEEDDNRLRTSKQLCHRDPGPQTIDGVSPADLFNGPIDVESDQFQTQVLGQYSQGCLPRSLFDTGNPADPNDNGAYGTPNGNALPFVRALRMGSFRLDQVPQVPFPFAENCVSFSMLPECVVDPLRAGPQSRDLRTVYTPLQPEYRAGSDYYELSFEFDLTDVWSLSSQTVYMENELFATQDFLRFRALPMFNDSTNSRFPYKRGISPGGVFQDPNLGPSSRLIMQDLSQQDATQFSQELRLTSNDSGPWNFSLGANYTRFKTTTDYFVFSNAFSALVYSGHTPYIGNPFGYNVPWVPTGPDGEQLPALFAGPGGTGAALGCSTYIDPDSIRQGFDGESVATCVYVQPGGIEDIAANPEGHQFFLSRNPYNLDSAALFGEAYYQLTPEIKLTAGLRVSWDRKVFTPIPSQTLLPDWRGRIEGGFLGTPAANPFLEQEGEIPEAGDLEAIARWCDPITGISRGSPVCALGGTAENGRGYPALPDIIQEWWVPTGRIGIDWQPLLSFTDETLIYAFFTHGYKGGGANPPTIAWPQGLLIAKAQGAAAPPTFEPEYVNAFEIGTKNTLLDGALMLNGSVFYYDYTDYQVSKIVDRSAANENFDATIWGLELESVLALTPDTLLNASIGYLRTRIADGEESLDLMNRTQNGGERYVNPEWAALRESTEGDPLGRTLCEANPEHVACQYPDGFDEWMVVKPTLSQSSNCIAPVALVRWALEDGYAGAPDGAAFLCPGGQLVVSRDATGNPEIVKTYNPITDAPNGSAGFFADIGGNELPNAPQFTVSLGAQHTYYLPGGNWSATGRVDWYWQDESFHRVYNTEYDQLRAWDSTNLSFWVSNDRHQLTIEAYVKNVFDEAPITGAFLNSDDTGLSTNVFTLDPRLIGLSIRKRF
ncbi:TonB-dependent receptor plug domain-containing protein [Flagellatimonas centrodinii]|uniref:TonB-dependent receptor domain-containing protein n=1 Tax=Flagellatimonas centrodinii TaxID=2806210 RepID=UPI001FEFC712|nr:TonB-dependent receptor [Flagellatimonas centrodinii]ULQ47064.1 TonB-dependent receptor plug domain-containing protein [Flagellatimonas centrodinii]